jgi:CheY-like chemotaxis protein
VDSRDCARRERENGSAPRARAPARCRSDGSEHAAPGGFEATTRILEEAPETAIVVLTGSNDPADVERARTAGAADYVTKDPILAELAAAIRSAAR